MKKTEAKNARAEILKAADQLFGKQGFDATSTREIAERSGVNKALIHYHFKNKDALLESVLDQYYQKLAGVLLAVINRPGSAEQNLHLLIDLYLDFLSENLNFSRIVQRESAGGKHLSRIQKHLVPIFQAGSRLVQGAYPESKSGELSARHLIISFYGMIVSWFTYSRVIEHLLDKDPLGKKELELRRRHLHRMLELILEPLARR